MTTAADIVSVARSYLDVPWRHQGRSRFGVDCIGLPILVAHELGLSNFDTVSYGRVPDGKTLQAGMGAHLNRVHGEPQPGDILLMRFQEAPQHVAIVTDKGIIHAYASVRKVVEHRLDDVWRARIVAAYRFKGID